MIENAYPESVETSGKYLRQALQHITRFKLPYNPISYALWYEYASGRDKELIKDLKEAEKDDKQISFRVVLKLFRTYLADQQVRRAEKKTHEFQLILSEICRHLADSGVRIGSQGQTLQGYIREMETADSTEKIAAIAGDILAETTTMIEESQILKQQLEEAASEVDTLKFELEGIKKKAKTDMLTDLLNRRGFEETMEKILEISSNDNIPLSAIILDIDHFKKVNDTHGHLIGDNVLKMLSRLLREHIKGRDIAARFGGEEFIIVLPDTPLKGAFALAEKIRTGLKSMRWIAKDTGKPIGSISISSGVAQHRPYEDLNSLIQRADDALYLAKNSGRNRTVTEQDLKKAG